MKTVGPWALDVYSTGTEVFARLEFLSFIGGHSLGESYSSATRQSFIQDTRPTKDRLPERQAKAIACGPFGLRRRLVACCSLEMPIPAGELPPEM